MLDLPPPDPSLEIVIASQGMSKGLRQTEGAQLVGRGEIELGHLYLGLLAKNVTSPVTDVEAQAYLGYRTRAGGFDLNGSIGYHRQLGAGPAADGERFEFQLSAARPLGPVTPRLAAIFSPDDFGATGHSLYVEGGASLRVSPAASVSANIGRRERAGAPDYTAFNAGASYAIGTMVTLDLRYYDTARSGLGEIYEPRVVGAVRLRF
jgi:Gram-negative porin